jgi:Nif-specific regulatory protein
VSRNANPPAVPSHASEVQKLSSLLEISQALSGASQLKPALHRVLEVLERHHGVIRSTVTLLSEESGELHIEASNGLTGDGERARYKLGEGITGRVVESGKPVVVPQVSREPLLLNRAAQRKGLDKQELSFICIPIILNRRPAGALSVDLRFKKERDYDRSARFFRLVGSMIAQALRVQRSVEAERQ